MLAAKVPYENDFDESENDTLKAPPLAATRSTGSADDILTAAISAISSLTYVGTISNISKYNSQTPILWSLNML